MKFVKRPRKTYRNPLSGLTPEEIERLNKPRDNQMVSPFTDAELAFLRSLGSDDNELKEQQ